MKHEVTETLTAGPAQGLAGLLGVPLPDLATAGLPALWHWVYLLDRPPQADLGPDGHPVRGVVPVPPAPGLRRMWAGGVVRTVGPLVVDRVATRTSFVAKTQEKLGRTGAMTFVTVRHEVSQDGRVVVEEDQHIVYRAATAPDPAGGAEATQAVASEDVPPAPDEWVIDPSSTLLARYSALTYNGHRIHYDRDFTRDVEGYPGLLVHGPLQAVAMAEAARRHTGGHVRPVIFDYRLVSPLFDHQGMVVCARPDDDDSNAVATRVRDRAGRTTAQGHLRRNVSCRSTRIDLTLTPRRRSPRRRPGPGSSP